MGLFDTSKKTHVSSVAYNMGGPEEDRPDFLKSIVLESVMTSKPSISDEIVSSYFKGPGMDQRAFYRWAKAYYPEGKCLGKVNQARAVSAAAVEAEITVPPGGSVEVHAAFIDMGDIVYWAERWLLANDPALYPTAWVAEFDTSTNEMVIDYPSGPDTRVEYAGFQSEKKYVYAYYTKTFSGGATEEALFIYKIGTSKPALDALDVDINTKPEIFPVIPLRVDNKAIDHADFAADFEQHAKAFKKATGTEIGEALVAIEDNPDVADIDFAFLVHGVELNTSEKQGKRYLYEFLKSLIPDQRTTPVDLSNWITWSLGYTSQKAALNAWKAAQSDPMDPLYGTAKPTVPVRSELEVTRFEVKTSSSLRYETHMGWVTIDENVFAGVGRPGARSGDLWFEVLSDVTIPGVPFDVTGGAAEAVEGSMSRFRLFWQSETAVLRVLTVYGMFHENFVYDGKTVQITAKAALEDADESGFVVPLHYPTLVALPMSVSTQLSVSNRILVFNCYEVVKTRWYEKAVFRFIFILAIAAVTAVAFPAGVGLLGSNLAVGAALGATGTAALIIGGITNAVAAIVLVTLIETASVAVFGEEVGIIVAAIASFVTMQYVSGFTTTGNWAFNLGDMIKAENLLKLTDAATGGVQRWAQMTMGNLQTESAEAYDDFTQAQQELENKKLAEFGYGQIALNPLLFLDMGNSASLETIEIAAPESSQDFLTRTLLTGSDIVEMSLAITKNFPQLALELPSL